MFVCRCVSVLLLVSKLKPKKNNNSSAQPGTTSLTVAAVVMQKKEKHTMAFSFVGWAARREEKEVPHSSVRVYKCLLVPCAVTEYVCRSQPAE